MGIYIHESPTANDSPDPAARPPARPPGCIFEKHTYAEGRENNGSDSPPWTFLDSSHRQPLFVQPQPGGAACNCLPRFTFPKNLTVSSERPTFLPFSPRSLQPSPLIIPTRCEPNATLINCPSARLPNISGHLTALPPPPPPTHTPPRPFLSLQK